MFTPAIFKEKFRRTFAAWKFHGFLPKEKGSTAQNHAQLKEVLKTFATVDSRLHSNVHLPIGPNGSLIQCDIKTCLLYAFKTFKRVTLYVVGMVLTYLMCGATVVVATFFSMTWISSQSNVNTSKLRL
jgi:hypothetical protein